MWRAELDKVSHRPYSTGFYYGPPGQYTDSARYIRLPSVRRGGDMVTERGTRCSPA